MNEDISVIDWFTKTRDPLIYPHETDPLLDKLIEEIGSVLRGRDLQTGVDAVAGVIERSSLLQRAASNSLLPICSLYQSLRNTAGIATCLIIDRLRKDSGFSSDVLSEYGLSQVQTSAYSDRDLIALMRLAAFLHDIGKLRPYTRGERQLPYDSHAKQAGEIVTEILRRADRNLIQCYALDKILPVLVERHHDPKTQLEEILSCADTVASTGDTTCEIFGELHGNEIVVRSEDKVFPHEIQFDGGSASSTIIGYGGEATGFPGLKVPPEPAGHVFSDATLSGKCPVTATEPAEIPGDIGIFALDTMQIQQYISESSSLPMIRGGSAIVDDMLQQVRTLIAREICPEAILFAGGGNLLALIPTGQAGTGGTLAGRTKEIVRSVSEGGLQAAVVTAVVPLSDLAADFSGVLARLQEHLDEEKNTPAVEMIETIAGSESICPSCSRRRVNGVIRTQGETISACSICAKKYTTGKEGRWEVSKQFLPEELLTEYGLNRPVEMKHIGPSVAVISADANMMGRLFAGTRTPAGYTNKSAQFDRKFRTAVRETIASVLGNKNLRQLIVTTQGNRKYVGFDVLYAGGDDLLLIINARAALPFVMTLLDAVAKVFTFDRTFSNGLTWKNPVVTLSCGVSFADANFPIYFLIDSAREMEKRAKGAFRKGTETDRTLKLIKLPVGAVACTAVSGAMPSDEWMAFVVPDNSGDYDLLSGIISDSLNPELWTGLSGLLNRSFSPYESLTYLKYLYGAGMRKKGTGYSDWIDFCESASHYLQKAEVLALARNIIPLVRAVPEDSP